MVPVLQISLFCLCIGQEPYNLKFGIVNNETIYNSTNNGSLLYVNELNEKTFNKQFVTWDEAYRLTRKGEMWGFVDISINFTQDTSDKYY